MVAAGVATAISAVTILESVAAVGAALSVVGMVTKNKTLTMVGAGLGAIGGFGALAAGALGGGAALFGTATAGDAAAATAAGDSAFITGTAAGDAALGGGTGAGALGGGVSGAALTTETAGLGAVNAVPDVIATLAPQDAAALQAQQALVPPGTNDVGGAITSGTAADARDAADIARNQLAGGLNTSSGAINPPTVQTFPGMGGSGTGTPTPVAATPAATSTSDAPFDLAAAPKGDTGTSAFGNIVKYASDHPVIAFGALQAGSSLLQGWTSSLTPAQVAALNAQAAANDSAAALTRQQTANLAGPKAVASSTPVTGTPAQLVPTPQGLINQPRPAQVTGAPA
jgi:hypothetical protein